METSTENVLESGELPINSAWKRKDYDCVLSLLQQDSIFPENFSVEELSEQFENQKYLKEFTRERNLLHEWIINNELDELKLFTSKKRSKYFFNDQNQSAAFTALSNKKFKIYAYLLSIGVILTDDESCLLDYLSAAEKHNLQDVMLLYFPKSEKSHIYYLISKTKIKSEKPFEQNERSLIKYFEELNLIKSVCVILKVIQYVPNLDLVLDLDSENLETLCLTTSASEDHGLTNYLKSTIYVAAGGNKKGKEKEVLGTLAHELTHMAMQLVFKNNCKPYLKSDKIGESDFKELTEFLLTNIKNIKGLPSEIFARAFSCYKENEYHSELIVRVPHILAQYRRGNEWLEKNARKLLDYFNNRVIDECEKFIEQNFLLKPKSFIRSLNESEGEIINIKKCGLLFKNIDKMKNILNDPNKNIFALITDYTWLGLLRALQALYGTDYVEFYDKFLVFKFQNILKIFDDVEYAFNSEATEVLFIECPENISDDDDTFAAFENLTNIVREKENKKIVFIMKMDEYENFIKIIEELELCDDFVQTKDEDFSIYDLENDSKEKILRHKILFQGKELFLWQLISDYENPNLLKIVNAEIIQDLLNNKKIKIGSKLIDTSSLEGAYTDVVYEVNLDSLIYEMKNSIDIFFISGKKMPERKLEFHNYVNQEIDMSLVGELKSFEYEISNDKRIFLVDASERDDDHFKIFCNFNPKKKIYFIKESNEFVFILQKFYNPDFYFKRQLRKYKNIVFKEDILSNKNNDDSPQEMKKVFIIGQENDSKMQHSYINSSTVKFVDIRKIDEECENYKDSGLSVHVLKLINDNLFWVKSFGPISELREWIDIEKSEIFVEEEEKMVAKILKEKVMILSDDPGMGKSTTLTKLYEIQSVLDTHWVIRINLKDHIPAIQKITDVNIKQLITFLTDIDPKLKNNFSKNLLEVALDINQKFKKILLLCFDGFDELLDSEDRDKMIVIFKFLKENTACKIWVTTRQHFSKNLEDQLLVWNIKFKFIDDLLKMEFIANYMKDRLRLIFAKEKFDEVFKKDEAKESKLWIFTKAFITKAKSIFKNDLERFIGTPLQLLLLLENSVPTFREWIEDSKTPDFSYLGNNLLDVYEKFFDRKYDIYNRKKNFFERGTKVIQKNSLDKWHEKIAEALILNKEISNDFIEVKSSLLLLGITKDENGAIGFVHFTFREYFFSKFIIKKLKKKDSSKQSGGLCDIFLEEILAERKYQVIRSFIEVHLESSKIKESFQKYEETFRPKIVSLTKVKKANYDGFNFAIEERNNNIFNLLIDLQWSESEYFIVILNYNKKPCFHSAIQSRNNFALDKIIKITSQYKLDRELIMSVDYWNHTPFHSALFYKNENAANRIIEIALKYKIEPELIKDGRNAQWTKFNNAVEMKNDFAFNKIIKIALKYKLDRELVSNVGDWKMTPIRTAIQFHNKVAFDRLIEIALIHKLNQEILKNVDNEKKTLFHFAVKYKNNLALEKIIDIASKCNLEGELLSNVDFQQMTPFHTAIIYKNDFALNKIIKIALDHNLELDILRKVNERGRTPFHVAIVTGNDNALNRIIEIELPNYVLAELISKVDGFKKTPFHSAVELNNEAALNKIIKIATELKLDQELINNIDADGRTSFHRAVECNNDDALQKIVDIAFEYNVEKELINNVDNRGITSIHTGIKWKNVKGVDKIIEIAEKYNSDKELLSFGDCRLTPFHMAVEYKNDHALDRIIKIALKYNLDRELLNNIDNDKKTPLHTAVTCNNNHALDEIIKIALKYGIDKELLKKVDKYHRTPFHLAVASENDYALDKICEMALKDSLDKELLNKVDFQRKSPLYTAVELGSDHALKEIIKIAEKYYIIDILIKKCSIMQMNPFHEAVARKNNNALDQIIEIAERYNLDQEISVKANRLKMTPFHTAVKLKNDHALNRIIKIASKNDLEMELLRSRSRKQRTPFYSAVKFKNDHAFRKITEIAFNCNSELELLNDFDYKGMTPYHTSIRLKNDFAFNEIVNIAKRLEVSPTLQGMTPFHYAVQFKNDHALNVIIDISLEHNLYFDLLSSRNEQKMTAFHLAVEYNNNLALDRIIEIALKHELDLELIRNVNHKQMTPFHSAVMSRNNHAFDKITEIASNYNLEQELLSNVNDRNMVPIHTAVEVNNDYALNRILEIALKYNLDKELLSNVSIEERTPFHTAVKSKNHIAFNKIIEIALKYKLDQELLSNIDVEGMTLFHTAAKVRNEFAWDKFIELTSNYSLDEKFKILSAVDTKGNTVFHLAVVSKVRNYYPVPLIEVDGVKKPAFSTDTIKHENDYTFNQVIQMMSNFNLSQKYHLLSVQNADGETVLHKAVNLENNYAKDQIIKMIHESGFSEEQQSSLLSNCDTSEIF